MKSFSHVITTPTADTPGTIIELHFPDKRYFFGQLAEGTQRACTERGARLTYLTDIFITGRTEWANTGGLVGMILTIADSVASSNAAHDEQLKLRVAHRAANPLHPNDHNNGVGPSQPNIGQAFVKGSLNVHGATNLTHTLATCRRFVFRKGMPVYVKEYSAESVAKQASTETTDPFETPTWSDSNIKVWALPIKPLSSSSPDAHPSRSHSPRKRSLEEFQENEQAADGADQRASDLSIRQSIVTNMFNSSWKMDSLLETPLAEVSMPATLFVRNPQTKDLERYKGPLPGDDQPLPKINVLVRKPWPGATVTNVPPTSPSPEALSYIIRSHDVRGKFDAAKAKELKVPKGQAYGKLTRGENVTSEDGKTITPEMVLGQPRLGKGTAIMDLPSSEYVESLLNRPEWKSPAVTTELSVFFWILGPGVGSHPKLQEFIASMSHCKHTVSSSDYSPNYLAFTSAATATIRLARLKADSYSVPVHDNTALPQKDSTVERSESQVPHSPENLFEPLKPGFVFDMEPQFKVKRDEGMEPLNTALTVSRIPKAIEQRMMVIHARVAKPKFQKYLADFRKDLPGAEAEIIALGTGSSSPSKYRNVSATLIHAPGYGYYLLDCGENTLGQLKRVFEPEQLREVLRNLRMIWISHLHADHHLGIASVIKAWYRENYGFGPKSATPPEKDMEKILQEKRLFVVSDEMMITWLEEYASVEDIGFDKVVPLCAHPTVNGSSITTDFTFRHVQNGGPPFGRQSRWRTTLDFNDQKSPLTPLLKSAVGLDNILVAPVKHCRASLALSLVFPDGFKVSYSGDARPSEKFASIGRDSTVLIHEATFQDNMVGSAIAKRHSTFSEALEVGRLMRARSIFLTHFSQRYQKIVQVDQQADPWKEGKNVASNEEIVSKMPADPDVPLEDPEAEPEPTCVPASLESGVPLLDDITEQKKPLRVEGGHLIPGVNAPVAAAMDYMRVKIGDLPLAQAFAPAVERLIELIERDSDRKSELERQERQAEEEARKSQKQKKHGGGKAAASAGAGAAVAAVASTTEPEVPQKSVWSASESESGWETSDCDFGGL